MSLPLWKVAAKTPRTCHFLVRRPRVMNSYAALPFLDKLEKSACLHNQLCTLVRARAWQRESTLYLEAESFPRESWSLVRRSFDARSSALQHTSRMITAAISSKTANTHLWRQHAFDT
jgi:hypothetical protein